MYGYVCFCILEHLGNSYMDSNRKKPSILGVPSELHLYLWVFFSWRKVSEKGSAIRIGWILRLTEGISGD